MSKALLSVVKTVLDSDCLDAVVKNGEIEVFVAADRLVAVLETLKTDSTTEMNQLVDLCGVDYVAIKNRFEVVYQLLSLKHNTRLRVRVEVAEGESVPSVVPVYPSAEWFEREAYDLFGIPFDNHPDLRRILTDYDFEGHPLRRDFPLSGHVQLRYDDLEGRVVREPVQLEDPYRSFKTQSQWRGLTDVQKRGRE